MRDLLLASLVVVCPLAGCVDAADVAKTRAANDFNCNEDKVDVENIGGTSYKARGCGQSEVYDCAGSDAYRGTVSNYTCVPEHSSKDKDEDER